MANKEPATKSINPRPAVSSARAKDGATTITLTGKLTAAWIVSNATTAAAKVVEALANLAIDSTKVPVARLVPTGNASAATIFAISDPRSYSTQIARNNSPSKAAEEPRVPRLFSWTHFTHQPRQCSTNFGRADIFKAIVSHFLSLSERVPSMSNALVIVDIQNDYFPGGRMTLYEIHRAADNAAKLLAHFRDTNRPVFHIQHTWEDPSAPFFVAGTPGAEIHESVAPRAGETVVVKHFPNSFRESPLLEDLRRASINDLTICGAMSHVCIDATTRAAADFGFNCTVAHDACATRDVDFNGQKVAAPDVHAAYMGALGFAYAKMVATADAVGK